MARFLAPALALAIVASLPAQGDSKLSTQQTERAHVLMERLGSPDFDERREAADELLELGKGVLPLLEDVLKESDDPEVRWQARRLVRKLRGAGDQKGDAKLQREERDPESRGTRQRRNPDLDLRIPSLGFDFFKDLEELEKRLDAMRGMRALDRDLFGRDLQGLFHDGPQGRSLSKSIKIQSTPDGVRVEVEEGKDGDKDRKVYEAPDMETLLEKHPELKDKLSGWSSRRRQGRWFEHLDKTFQEDLGKDLRERILRDIRRDLRGLRGRLEELDPWDIGDLKKLRERLNKMFDGVDVWPDRDSDTWFRFKVETPKGAKEWSFPPRRKRKVEAPEGDKLEKVKEGEARDEAREEEAPPSGPRLGVYLRPGLPAAVREFLDLPEDKGLWIDRVADGSIAARAGLRAGDIVTKLDGKWVGSPEDVQRALEAATGEVKVEWIRKGERRAKTVSK